MPSRTPDKTTSTIVIVPVQKAFSLFTRRSDHRLIHGLRLSLHQRSGCSVSSSCLSRSFSSAARRRNWRATSARRCSSSARRSSRLMSLCASVCMWSLPMAVHRFSGPMRRVSVVFDAVVFGSGTTGLHTAVSSATLHGPSCRCRPTRLWPARQARTALRMFRTNGSGLAEYKAEATWFECGRRHAQTRPRTRPQLSHNLDTVKAPGEDQ